MFILKYIALVILHIHIGLALVLKYIQNDSLYTKMKVAEVSLGFIIKCDLKFWKNKSSGAYASIGIGAWKEREQAGFKA